MRKVILMIKFGAAYVKAHAGFVIQRFFTSVDFAVTVLFLTLKLIDSEMRVGIACALNAWADALERTEENIDYIAYWLEALADKLTSDS